MSLHVYYWHKMRKKNKYVCQTMISDHKQKEQTRLSKVKYLQMPGIQDFQRYRNLEIPEIWNSIFLEYPDF